MTETWTAPELREHLGQVGVVPELMVPVRATGADLDPPTAQDRARTRKLVVAVGAVVILALVVTAALRQALREGFTSGSVLLVLLLVSQVALRWFGGPSIMGAPSAGSEADLFVTALRTPTAAVRSVRRRWLVVVDAGQQLVLTAEVGWSVRGPERVLEIRWSDKNGRIVRPRTCGVASAVGSSCASPIVRRSRCCWDDRPACRSPTPSPASGPVVDRLPQFGTHSERGSHEKDHRLDDGVHRRVLRGA